MASLANLNSVGAQAAAGNACLSYVTLAINAGSAKTLKSTGTFYFAIDGVIYSHAALSAQAFSSGHTALAAGEKCFFAVCVDAAGTISTVQGPIFKSTTLNGSTVYVLNTYGSNPSVTWQSADPYPANSAAYATTGEFLPVVPDTKAVIGLVKIEGAFTPTSTALDAAGVTATYYNVLQMPSAESNL